jgi:hypothetical protein
MIESGEAPGDHASTPAERHLSPRRACPSDPPPRRPAAGHGHHAAIAPVAALLADPARAAMFGALLSGPPLAAGELGQIAGVSPATFGWPPGD